MSTLPEIPLFAGVALLAIVLLALAMIDSGLSLIARSAERSRRAARRRNAGFQVTRLAGFSAGALIGSAIAGFAFALALFVVA